MRLIIVFALLIGLLGSFSKIKKVRNSIIIKKIDCGIHKFNIYYDTSNFATFAMISDSLIFLGHYHNSGFSPPEIESITLNNDSECGVYLNTYILSMDVTQLYSNLIVVNDSNFYLFQFDSITLGNVVDTSSENIDFVVKFDALKKSVTRKSFHLVKKDTFSVETYQAHLVKRIK